MSEQSVPATAPSPATTTVEGIVIESVDWDDPRAAALRDAMDAELRPRYADRVATRPPESLRQRLRIDKDDVIFTAIALDETGEAIAHAALRRLGGEIEVKRVFTRPHARGTGVSVGLMRALEEVAKRHGARRLILQTGDRQPEAVGLYRKLGYRPIPVYPPYHDFPASKCFEKLLE